MNTPVVLFSFLLIGTAIGYDVMKILRDMGNPGQTTLHLHNFKLKCEDIGKIAAAVKGTTITTLIISWDNLGERGTQILANALRNSQITFLKLFKNNVGDGGAVAIANVLKDTNITHLNLHGNVIGDEGASAIAKVLRDTRITRLDLGYNKIGDDGAKALATGLIGSRVNLVHLDGNRIEDDGAEAIADSLNQTIITGLSLTMNNVRDRGEQAIIEALDGTGVTFLGSDVFSGGARVRESMSRNRLRIDRLYRHLNNFLTSRNGSLEFNIEGALTNKSDYIEFVRIIASNKPVYRLRFTTENRTKFTANRIEDFVDNIESRLEDCFRKSDLVVKGFRDFLATTKNGSLEFRIDYAHSNKSDYIDFAGLIARYKSFYRGGSITEAYGKGKVRDFVDNIESRVEECFRESEFMYQQLESFLVTKDESLEFYVNYTIPRKFEYLNFTIVILKDEQGWMNYFLSKGTRENWSYLVKDFFKNIQQRLIEFFGGMHSSDRIW